jgi:hypothetical protein
VGLARAAGYDGGMLSKIEAFFYVLVIIFAIIDFLSMAVLTGSLSLYVLSAIGVFGLAVYVVRLIHSWPPP